MLEQQIEQFFAFTRDNQYKEADEFLSSLSKDNIDSVIHAEDDTVFKEAAENGYDEILKILLKHTTDASLRSKMIHDDSNYAFKWAAANLHTKVVKLLLQSVTDEEARHQMIHHDDDLVFRSSLQNNEITKSLIEATSCGSALGKMIHSGNNAAFIWAAANGKIEIIKDLIERTPNEEARHQMIHANKDAPFKFATGNGHLHVSKFLIHLTPIQKDKEEMLHADNDYAFREASGKGGMEAIEFLLELTPNLTVRTKMLHAKDNDAYKRATHGHHAEVLSFLIGLIPERETRNQVVRSVARAEFDKLILRSSSNTNEIIKRSINRLLEGFIKSDPDYIKEILPSFHFASSLTTPINDKIVSIRKLNLEHMASYLLGIVGLCPKIVDKLPFELCYKVAEYVGSEFRNLSVLKQVYLGATKETHRSVQSLAANSGDEAHSETQAGESIITHKQIALHQDCILICGTSNENFSSSRFKRLSSISRVDGEPLSIDITNIHQQRDFFEVGKRIRDLNISDTASLGFSK